MLLSQSNARVCNARYTVTSQVFTQTFKAIKDLTFSTHVALHVLVLCPFMSNQLHSCGSDDTVYC